MSTVAQACAQETESKSKVRSLLLAMTDARLYKQKQYYTDNNMKALKIKSTSNLVRHYFVY